LQLALEACEIRLVDRGAAGIERAENPRDVLRDDPGVEWIQHEVGVARHVGVALRSVGGERNVE
jgi:hypothetical protein